MTVTIVQKTIDITSLTTTQLTPPADFRKVFVGFHFANLSPVKDEDGFQSWTRNCLNPMPVFSPSGTNCGWFQNRIKVFVKIQ